MATRNLHAPLLTVEEFLEIRFPTDTKAELDNGVIRMMAGGTLRHSEIQTNLIVLLREKLRGSGCKPYGSDTGIRAHDLSLRYPDVSVLCGVAGPESDDEKAVANPRMIAEVLSPTTRGIDMGVKLSEYKSVPSLETILLVDPDGETVTLLQRDGVAWPKTELTKGADVAIADLQITLAAAEIFARD
jgi:Uma2 family endonuclease